MIRYVRFRTSRQVLLLERQTLALQAEAERRGVELDIVKDNGASGALQPERRPGMRYTLDLLARGEADGLIVAKLDRLGRNAADVTALVELAQAQGWTLVVLDPALGLSTSAGRMVATMLAAVAEMEAELVAERTAAIVEMKREQGKSLGAADRLCRPRSSTASSGRE